MEHSTERFEFRTAESDAMEAEELQNALNQPNHPPEGAAGGEPAAGGGGGAETATAAEGAAAAPAKGGCKGGVRRARWWPLSFAKNK